MEKAVRNNLYAATVNCRRLLEDDMARLLEGYYGIHDHDGTVEPLEKLVHMDAVGRADRQAMEAAIRHEKAAGASHEEAIHRYLRESAFTFLNRLVALKLMEHPSRALVVQSVGAGDSSKGFHRFRMVSPQAMRGEPDGGYRLYLELLFDDLTQVVGPLFDRSVPSSILFPSERCLREVLALLNDPRLEDVWGSDEAIGWVYQYFTPTELREQAREESAAPRTPYELAFRNQFYTPRYVVAFLADNTLGRMWWEMRGGQTRLTESCKYLLQNDAQATETQTAQPNSDETPANSAPLQQALGERRDPRDFRILDPACGSGHFLLYCFDLLLTIYEEAYDDPEIGAVLRADYPDREEFRRAVPRLILEHNLHGVDIDLRACQIATLALWLRAQRAWGDMGLKPRQRPRVERIRIVCAEPMPGEYDLLGEFCRNLQPMTLGNLVREIWDKMRLAGELGSLLKIEQEIRNAIQHAHHILLELPQGIQLTLFGPQQLALPLSPADLKDDEFWAHAEARVLDALHQFARHTANGQNVLRRLFVDDAIQGMAFIDLFQRPFDVVLMNPPFGAATLRAKEYMAQNYPRTKNDLYAAFVERGLEVLRPGGYLGAITSRTGFFLTSFQRWREEILLKEAQLIALADLGYGVLDTAMVETAAYVLRKGGGSHA